MLVNLLQLSKMVFSLLPEFSGVFLQVAGVEYQFNVTHPGIEGSSFVETHSRLKYVAVGDDILVDEYQILGDINQTYTVATNSFMASGDDRYYSFGGLRERCYLTVRCDRRTRSNRDTL